MNKLVAFCVALGLLALAPLSATLAQTKPTSTAPKPKTSSPRPPAGSKPAPTAKTPLPTTSPKPLVAAPAPPGAKAAVVTAPKAATTAAFAPSSNVLSLGIGLGNRYGYVGSGVSVAPAVSLAYERGIRALGPGTLGVGGFVGYQHAASSALGYNYSFSDLLVAVRGSYHYSLAPPLEVYGSLALGVRHAGVSYSGPGDYAASATDSYAALLVGGRYYFSRAVGAFAELGYDQTYAKIGLSARF